MTEACGRIVLFGATGYTGRLTAEALAGLGERPVLAGRSRVALAELAAQLGGESPWTIAVADVTDKDSLRGLLRRGDVIVSTVGPFLRYGEPLIKAAIEAGACYLDVCGEAPFIREVYQTYGPLAERTGATLIPACAYWFLAGTLAGSIALDEARTEAARVDIAYFVGGGSLWLASPPASLRSTAEVFGRPGFTYRKGIVPMGWPEVRDFMIGGRIRPAAMVAAAEHFTLPRLHPDLQAVDVYVGMLGSATRLMVAMPPALLTRVGGPALRLMAGLGGRRPRRPILTARVAAIAYDPVGLPLAEVHMSGRDPYDFTAGILAWCAHQARQAGTAPEGGRLIGAVSPVEAFGLGPLQAGCAEAGISRLSG